MDLHSAAIKRGRGRQGCRQELRERRELRWKDACCLDLDGDVPVDDGGGEEPAKARGKKSGALDSVKPMTPYVSLAQGTHGPNSSKWEGYTSSVVALSPSPSWLRLALASPLDPSSISAIGFHPRLRSRTPWRRGGCGAWRTPSTGCSCGGRRPTGSPSCRGHPTGCRRCRGRSGWPTSSARPYTPRGVPRR